MRSLRTLVVFDHTVTFLPEALRFRTRTLFCFQGTGEPFFSGGGKAEMQGLKPEIASPLVETVGLAAG